MNDFYKRLADEPITLAKELKEENDRAVELLKEILDCQGIIPAKVDDKIRDYLSGEDDAI